MAGSILSRDERRGSSKNTTTWWATFLEHMTEGPAERDSQLQEPPGDYMTTYGDTFLLRRGRIWCGVEDPGWKENPGLGVRCWTEDPVRSLTSSCVCVCGKSFNFSGLQFLLLQRGCQFIFQVHFTGFHEHLGGRRICCELISPFLWRVTFFQVGHLIFFTSVAGRITPLFQDVHVLILGTSDCVSLHDKRTLQMD